MAGAALCASHCGSPRSGVAVRSGAVPRLGAGARSTLRISEGGLALGKRAWPSLRSRPTATSRPKCSAALNAPTAAPLPCYAMLVCSSRTFQFAARPQNRMLCPRRGSPSQQRPALLHSAAAQTSMDTNVHGHKRPWTQTSMDTITNVHGRTQTVHLAALSNSQIQVTEKD